MSTCRRHQLRAPCRSSLPLPARVRFMPRTALPLRAHTHALTRTLMLRRVSPSDEAVWRWCGAVVPSRPGSERKKDRRTSWGLGVDSVMSFSNAYIQRHRRLRRRPPHWPTRRRSSVEAAASQHARLPRRAARSQEERHDWERCVKPRLKPRRGLSRHSREPPERHGNHSGAAHTHTSCLARNRDLRGGQQPRLAARRKLCDGGRWGLCAAKSSCVELAQAEKACCFCANEEAGREREVCGRMMVRRRAQLRLNPQCGLSNNSEGGESLSQAAGVTHAIVGGRPTRRSPLFSLSPNPHTAVVWNKTALLW